MDTHYGLHHGVSNLLDLFEEFDIEATFFVPMGPDRSGRAARRLVETPGFLRRMIRLRALRLYGMTALMAGTLVPAVRLGAEHPWILKRIVARGHELGLHGWDHFTWQERVVSMDDREVAEDLMKAAMAYQSVLGTAARSSAAPGWRTTERSLRAQEQFGFSYASDVRGDSPFYPWVEGCRLRTLQVPVTLPSTDELLAIGEESMDSIQRQCGRRPIEVMVVHAELEGRSHLLQYRAFLKQLRDRGACFMRLDRVAQWATAEPEKISCCHVTSRPLPGRAGTVAVQGDRV